MICSFWKPLILGTGAFRIQELPLCGLNESPVVLEAT